MVDSRGIVVPESTNLPTQVISHNGAPTESNAVNKTWHESYGATTHNGRQSSMENENDHTAPPTGKIRILIYAPQ